MTQGFFQEIHPKCALGFLSQKTHDKKTLELCLKLSQLTKAIPRMSIFQPKKELLNYSSSKSVLYQEKLFL